MNAVIVSTDVITVVNGQPARVWRGMTDAGVEFTAFIVRLAVDVDDDASQFEAELLEAAPPRELTFPEVLGAISTRML